MKKVLVALAVVLALVIVAALAVPALVPAERIKEQVIAQVKAATGRDLAIGGKVSVSVFPSLSVQVSDVALSNPAGFQAKDMVRLGALDVRLKLLPLLGGKVEVDSFVLRAPVISLEVDRQGRNNWTFASATPAPEPKAADKPKSSGGGGLSDLRLGKVAIQDGTLSYVDAKAGTKEEVSDLSLAIKLDSLDDPLSAEGGAKWRGQAIKLKLDVARPRVLVDGKDATKAGLSVAAEPVKLSFAGDLDGAGALKGDVDLSVPSIRNLVQWTTGKPLDAPGTGLGPLSVKGKLAAQGAKVSFSQAAIGLDAIKATGDVAVDTGGARPAIKGRLDVDALDLNPYLPPETAAQPAKPAQPAGKQDWSDEPMDASGLKAADVDFALSAGSITIRKIKIGKSALKLALANGKLNAELTQMALYNGSGTGAVAVDGSQPGVGLDARFALKGLQAAPFLTDAAGFDRVEGTANTDLTLSGRGRSQRQLVSSLAGKGAVTFLDGAIRGVNLAAMMRNVTTAFTDTGGAQKTDFAELAGTWTMTAGVLSNKDLALKSPLLRVEGAGTVDLPKRRLDYRVEPKASATLEGQGGKQDVAGLSVPVIVEGPWDNVSYRPDLAGMAKGAVGQAVQGAVGGKLPSIPAQSGSGGGSPLPINPGGLFGR